MRYYYSSSSIENATIDWNVASKKTKKLTGMLESSKSTHSIQPIRRVRRKINSLKRKEKKKQM